MAPELFFGLTVTDNYRLNILWPSQFVDLVHAGHWYPRWLPHAWGGFGSPVFYFYPPAFYWGASLIDVATAGMLATERLVPLASLTFLIISGLSMRAWLGSQVGGRRATVGAVAYMIAPFHLYHFYGTGALAEAASYASIPLVMLALSRLANGRRQALPLLTASYAMLLLSHLPTALMVTLFMIAPFTALLAWKAPRPLLFLGISLAGGWLAIALAAIFIVPALGLIAQVSPNALSGSFYQPENWFFWHLRGGSMAARMIFIEPVAAAAFVIALGVFAGARSSRSIGHPRFWSVLTMVLVLLIAGAVPFVWRLPGLSLVQFPWRALVLCEFTTVTAVTLGATQFRKPLLLLAIALMAFSYAVLGLIAFHTIGRTARIQDRASAEILRSNWDAPEYLPAGTRIELGKGPDDIRVDLPAHFLARARDPNAMVQANELPDGGLSILVTSPNPTDIEIGRFYFPHWKLRDSAGHAVPVGPDALKRVIRFNVPRGSTVYRLELGSAPSEVLARWISLAALIVLAALFARNWARRRSSQAIGTQITPWQTVSTNPRPTWRPLARPGWRRG